MRVTREYGCLIEDKGSTFHASCLIDPKGVLRSTSWFSPCIGGRMADGGSRRDTTMYNLPVGRSVYEASRVVQAFQFTVRL